MSRPIVSVILPNYNHSEFLDERLKSIYNQTMEEFEVILLDDCSTDSSREILMQYKNHKKTAHVIFNEENSGSTFLQWDKGIRLAKGKYVWIAESDDYSDLTFLEKVIAPLETDLKIGLSFCQSHSINRNSEITGNWKSHTSTFSENIFLKEFIINGNNFIEKFLIHKNVIPNVSAVVFRKQHLEQISPLVFKPFLKYNADWFYYLQIACISKISFIEKSLNYFRYHGNSVIAKAGGESGWMKIFKMEMEGRQLMLSYIRNCNPPNLKRIEEEAEKGNLKLRYLTAKGYLDRSNFVQSLLVIYNKPLLWKRIGRDIIRKIYKKWLVYR